MKYLLSMTVNLILLFLYVNLGYIFVCILRLLLLLMTICLYAILYLPMNLVKVLCVSLPVPVILSICLPLKVRPFTLNEKIDCNRINLLPVICIRIFLVKLLQMI